MADAGRAEAGLALARQEQPALILMDINLPGMDGVTATKQLKADEHTRHIPVMALTALSGEEDRRKGIEAGIDEYQIKLDRDEVLRALELLILRTRQ